jgi:3-hydroxyacyl-[acyl-carrier-protein] dehydratase
MLNKHIPLDIPLDHPAFAGHFPSIPIVPGVVLLDEVLYAIQHDQEFNGATWQISAVKFLSPLKPGEKAIIYYGKTANGGIAFEIVEGARQIVSGNLTLAPAL